MDEFVAPPELMVQRWFNTEPLSLRSLRGRVVVLHAFQMLCPGCVSHSLPQAERIYRSFSNDDVAVVGLHTVFEHHAAMTDVALEAFLHEYRITHPIGVDSNPGMESTPRTMSIYGMKGTPTLILIDREGLLRYQEFGRVDDLHLGVMLGHLLAEDGVNAGMHSPSSGERIGPGCDTLGCWMPVQR